MSDAVSRSSAYATGPEGVLRSFTEDVAEECVAQGDLAFVGWRREQGLGVAAYVLFALCLIGSVARVAERL